MDKLFAVIAAFGVLCISSLAHARDYPVTLTYVASADLVQGQPSIQLAPVIDERTNGPNWLGAIRGGYGNPLKVLVTDPLTVAQVVEQGIRDALAARNLAAQDGAHRLVVRLVRFDCNQLFPKEAHIVLAVRLEDAAGAVLYENQVHADKAGPGIGGGIFSPVEPLRALTNEVMQTGIDLALDDPAFRAALGAPASPVVVSGSEPETPPAVAPEPAPPEAATTP